MHLPTSRSTSTPDLSVASMSRRRKNSPESTAGCVPRPKVTSPRTSGSRQYSQNSAVKDDAGTTTEDIEKAVEQLPPRELARFRAWLEAFDARQFDAAIE